MNTKFRLSIGVALCVIVGALLSFSGCGSSNETASFSGTWTGTLSGQSITSQTFGMTLYQSGSSVTGEFLGYATTNTSIGGTVVGTVNGSTISVTSFTIPPGQPVGANAILSGNLTVNGTVVSGTLTGTNSSITLNLTQTK
ncbi:MAG: hypothetical protein P4M08_05450 [Oligoflexia bacterium]|nr:hypothetical protein [Oligoflexia bacterium]